MNFTEKEQRIIDEMKNLNITFIKIEKDIKESRFNDKLINKIYFQFPRKIGYLAYYPESKSEINPDYIFISNEDSFKGKNNHNFYEIMLDYVYENIHINVSFNNILHPKIIYKENSDLCNFELNIFEIKDNTFKAIAFDAVQCGNGDVLIDFIKEKVLNQ